MKKKWSSQWKSSRQKRKQRKYRHNAPKHVRHKFLSAHLSPDLRRQFERRSLPVRKGDEIEVKHGSLKGLRGVVERINMKKCKVYVENIKVKKVDGSEVMRALEPSNLMLLRLNLDDKKRRMALERSEKSKEK